MITTNNSCFYISPTFSVKKLSGLDSLYQDNRYVLDFYHFGGNVYCWAFVTTIVIADIKTQKIIKTIPYRQAWAMCKTSDSTMLVGSFAIDSIYHVNIVTGNKTYINNWKTPDGKPIGGYASTIFPIGRDRYAVGCRYYGVYILDFKNNSAQHLTHDPLNPASLKSNFGRRIFITHNDILFAHTRGISYTALDVRQFKRELSIVDKDGVKYEDGFNDFTEDDKGNLWIGTNSCLAYLNRKTNIAVYYPFYNEKQGPQKFKTIRTVAKDKLGRVWVGTFGGGLGRLLPNGKFKQIERNPADSGRYYPGHEIQAITTDKQGNFFICANASFSYFNLKIRAAGAQRCSWFCCGSMGCNKRCGHSP